MVGDGRMISIESTRGFVDSFLASDADLVRSASTAQMDAFYIQLAPAHDANYFGPGVKSPVPFYHGAPADREAEAARVGPRRVFRRDLYNSQQGPIVAIVTGKPTNDDFGAARYNMRFLIGETPDGVRILSRDQFCVNCQGVGCPQCDRGWMHFGPDVGYWGPKIALGEPVETVREARPGQRYVALWER